MIRHVEYSRDCNVYRVFFQDGTKHEIPGTLLGLEKGFEYHMAVSGAICSDISGGKQMHVSFRYMPSGRDYDQEQTRV